METSRPFTDIHLHGIGECGTQTDSPDEILSIAEMEGTEGVAQILLSIYPAPIPVMRRHMAAVKEAMKRQKAQSSLERSASRVEAADTCVSQPGMDNKAGVGEGSTTPSPFTRLPARILGVHVEGPFLNPTRCGALDPRTFLTPSWYAYRQLAEGFEETIKSITLAPELDGARGLIRQIVRSGARVSMGHSDATYSQAEAGFQAGATGVTHIFNAMRPFDHREPGISGFALMNPHIYVEVIADPYHLHLETLRLIFGVKPFGRILIVSDSVKDSSVLTVPMRHREAGQPRESTPAATDAGKLRGGSMSIVAASMRLIAAGIDEEAVLKAVTDNPHHYLGE